MSFFRFFTDCHYVSGSMLGAIYDLSRNRVISLSKTETNIVELWLENQEVEMVEKNKGTMAKELLTKFIKEGFGQLFDTPVVVEPYYLKCKYELKGLLESPPNLSVAYIQLSDNCDGKCKICKNSSYYYWQGCNSCIRWPRGGQGNTLEGKDISVAYEHLINLEVKTLTFSGGNPLINWPELVEVSRRFRKVNSNLNVVVHTSGSLINDLIVKEAKELGITFVFTLFGESAKTCKKVTGNQTLFMSFNQAINLCKQYGVTYKICLMITPENRKEFNTILDYAEKLGAIHIFKTELTSHPEKGTPFVSAPRGQERIKQVGILEYFYKRDFNTCLNRTIAISSSGAILPCPSWEEPLGNISDENNIYNVFKTGLINEKWGYTKDKVPICKECEFRYSCSDCSVLEWALNKDTSVKDFYCKYKPHLGQWSNV
ncbi:radical SAM protein [Desulfotomaculum sp. 1211_IL3151]|uniref:radical SAM protein n=1 Tax=Desulfotomaculum sp. 1211_IL3151 TaxID=3084055 RepID=UPI002FDAE82E